MELFEVKKLSWAWVFQVLQMMLEGYFELNVVGLPVAPRSPPALPKLVVWGESNAHEEVPPPLQQ